jgi:hypothetical protein
MRIARSMMGTLIFGLEALGVWLCAGFVVALCIFPASIEMDDLETPTGAESGDSQNPETSYIPPRRAPD